MFFDISQPIPVAGALWIDVSVTRPAVGFSYTVLILERHRICISLNNNINLRMAQNLRERSPWRKVQMSFSGQEVCHEPSLPFVNTYPWGVKMSFRNVLASGVLAVGCVVASSPALSFNLATDCGGPCPYVTYGDGNSYALPVNAYIYDQINGGGVGPGNPQYVASSPGQISSLTVVATGSDGVPVTTNYPGADDAYPTPTGVSGSTYFSTATETDPVVDFLGDVSTTWDVQLGALETFMGTDNSLIFFFNNNQINSGASTNQNLAAWVQLTITDPTNTVIAVFDFTNQNDLYAGIADGGGGTFNGDPGLYTHVGALDSPIAGDNTATDYVLSGGKLCADASGVVSCSAPHTIEFDMNLGANQAAYAIVFPELDTLLQSLFAGDTTGYTLNVNMRFGCDPATTFVDNPDINATDNLNCVARDLNNGYEQVFITTASNVTNVPEPSTILLSGLGMLVLGGLVHRRRRFGY